MRALVFTDFKTFPEMQDVERPTPGAGEVLLKVAGSGACHSDVGLFHEFDGDPTGGNLTPPFVLGHETSGWIEELGPGVEGLEKGDAYLAYGPIGCGRCPACSRGQDTYCHQPETVGYNAVGLGRDGGMAEYMTVPARNLIPLGDADPIDAAPLADAGLTPYHAIKRALPALAGGGKTAYVIGLGGLGQLAVQMLVALTGATVIASDMKPEAMEAAEKAGATVVPTGDGQVERVREITGGRGVDAVFDFVGVDATIAAAAGTVAQGGSLTVVGIGGGSHSWSFFTVPYEVNFSSTYWGTIEDLHEVVEMYRRGQIAPAVERYSLEDAPTAYERLRDGELSARAVIVPHEQATA